MLHLCAMWQSEKCFSVLNHYGGLDLNAKDKRRKSPVEYAIEYKCAKIKETLVSYRDSGVNFTDVEPNRLLSGELIAEDLETQNKNRTILQKHEQQSDNLKINVN